MGQLHQIRLQYDAQQDRGLLLVSTQARSEYRFWLTRRYVKLLWPVLTKLVESDEQVQRQTDQQAKKAVVSFQQEKALDESDFSTAYEKQGLSQPLGAAPVLLAKIQVKQTENGARLLCMHPLNGQGIELAMNAVLLHSLCKLVRDTVQVAGWDLELGPSQPTADAPRPKTQRLN